MPRARALNLLAVPQRPPPPEQQRGRPAGASTMGAVMQLPCHAWRDSRAAGRTCGGGGANPCSRVARHKAAASIVPPLAPNLAPAHPKCCSPVQLPSSHTPQGPPNVVGGGNSRHPGLHCQLQQAPRSATSSLLHIAAPHSCSLQQCVCMQAMAFNTCCRRIVVSTTGGIQEIDHCSRLTQVQPRAVTRIAFQPLHCHATCMHTHLPTVH